MELQGTLSGGGATIPKLLVEADSAGLLPINVAKERGFAEMEEFLRLAMENSVDV